MPDRLKQHYVELKKEYLQRGLLFEDECFPACPASLGCKLDKVEVKWKRPQEICDFPQFICQGMSHIDILQGKLGNCGFIAAVASLSLYPELMARIVPTGQSFQQDYAGIFHFQFWQSGNWVDVVIDDRLPVKDGKLHFMHSAQQNEFWTALLEKAYAKLNGSYSALIQLPMSKAFVDFTGGIVENINPKAPPPDFFGIIQRAVQKRSLMGASIESSSQEIEEKNPEGLVKGHAYSFTGVHEVELGSWKVRLLRLRNPWGKVEWNGRWSDNSPLWIHLDHTLRAKLHTRAEDGEFWMQMDDFKKFFDELDICNLTPSSVQDDQAEKWTRTYYKGAWVKGHNAGGCHNNTETFWTNPQFQVTLQEKDNDEDSCTLLVSLMQKPQQGRKFHSIGFETYKQAFIMYDVDKSGTINTSELRPALEGTGIHLNNSFMEHIVLKYGDRWQQLTFDKFLSCMSWLERIFLNLGQLGLCEVIRKCKTLDRNNSGVVAVTSQQEICDFPQFICQGMSHINILQGNLGNAVFLVDY
ncbi:calpain-12-like [Microcaecilia unicolor]|uniref:Calpain-12-like n=1 Tax=Microcaecilia unicolor TaxID=1415580 RepID=A0A6P7ZIL5_9AMPH|nr:calpain-12-like [Microcaecilia unicolor]